MPGVGRTAWIAAAAAASLILAIPAAAQATLTYTRNPLHPVIWVAKDDGTRAHVLVKGRDPHVSPDGKLIAYEGPQRGNRYHPELLIVPADGSAAPKRLLATWGEPFVFAFSPDSSTIVTVSGEGKNMRLVAINAATGLRDTLAAGEITGASISPDGTEVVYSKSGNPRSPLANDIFRVSLSGTNTKRLTKGKAALSPLWGPNGTIVFVRLLNAKKRRYQPENQLFLMDENGGSVKRLTHTHVDPLLSGLTPTDWSADGKRLLTEFGGEDTSYAVVVDPKTGAERALTKERETGFIGAALSADGKTVLGSIGEFEGSIAAKSRKVLSIPYGGGKPTVLAKGALEPDWSR